MVNKLINEFRKRFGFTKDIWMWTGYVLEDIMNENNRELNRIDVARKVDVLVDGRFILSKRDLKLKYRGSFNQRIIDMQKSQTFNTLILKEEYMQ